LKQSAIIDSKRPFFVFESPLGA